MTTAIKAEEGEFTLHTKNFLPREAQKRIIEISYYVSA
jgi:hypothetical protein